MGIKAVAGMWLLVVVSACAPPPTPFPVTPINTQVPTLAPEAATAAQSSSVLPTVEPVRYGVLPNAENHAPLEALQRANMQITILDETSDATQFDVMTGFGIYDGWVRTDNAPTVSLVLNTALPPLDSLELLALLRDSLQMPQVLAEIPGTEVLYSASTDAQQNRIALANMGYPNGITIFGRVDSIPGGRELLGTMAAANINVLAAQQATAPHLQVIAWDEVAQRENYAERFGAENVIDLYRLPISYYLNGEFLTAFTDDGWVIVSRGE